MFDFKVHFEGMPMFGRHGTALPQHGKSDERQTHSLAVQVYHPNETWRRMENPTLYVYIYVCIYIYMYIYIYITYSHIAII